MFGSLSWYGTKFIFLDQSASMVLSTLMFHSVHAGSFCWFGSFHRHEAIGCIESLLIWNYYLFWFIRSWWYYRSMGFTSFLVVLSKDLVLSAFLSLSNAMDQSKYLKLTHFMIRSCNQGLSFLVAQSNVRVLSVHSIHFLTCGTIISYDSLCRCGAFRLYGSIRGRCNYRLSRIIHRRWNCNTTWFSQLRGFYLLTWITLHASFYTSIWIACRPWYYHVLGLNLALRYYLELWLIPPGCGAIHTFDSFYPQWCYHCSWLTLSRMEQ